MSDELEVVESPEEKQGKEARKVAEQFEKNMQSLLAVFKSNPGALSGKNKIPNDELDGVMTELFEEETKEVREKFKVKAKNLIKSKVEFDKFLAEKKKEFENAVTNKKKEFNKEMQEAFALLGSVDKLRQDFLASSKSVEVEKTSE